MEKSIEKRFVVKFEEDELEHIRGILKVMAKVDDKFLKDIAGIETEDGMRLFRAYNTEMIKKLETD